MKQVAVIILNWNGAAMLKRFLPDVIATTDSAVADIIVADNGSSDDSIALLASEFPSVKVLPFDKNYGFAEGYNRAILEVQNPYAVLLNSDVATTSGWVNAMLEYMESHPGCAACQPKLRAVNEPEKFEYAGACGGFLDRNGYPYCRGRIFGTTETDHGQYDSEMDVDWASGAALMVRRDLYIRAGGLDPRFFAHMEEIDLCCRLRLMGYTVSVVPTAVVHHLGGGALPMGNPRKTYLNFRNNLLLLHKDLPPRGRNLRIFRRMLLDGVAWAKFTLTGDFASAGAVWRAHRDFRKMKSAPVTEDYSLKGTLDEDPAVDILAERPNIITQYYLKGHKNYSGLTRPSKKRYLLLSAIHALFVVLLCSIVSNIDTPVGDEKGTMQLMEIARRVFHNQQDKVPEELLAVNIAFDRELVDCYDDYGIPSGQTDITDRAKLLRFLEIADSVGGYKYIMFDVDLGISNDRDIDSMLLDKVGRMDRIVVPTNAYEEMLPEAVQLKSAPVSYTINFKENSFVKYRLKPSMPFEAAQSVLTQAGQEDALDFIRPTIIPRMDVRICEPYDEDGNKNWYNLGEDLLAQEEFIDFGKLIPGKIIIIGDNCDKDIHDTYVGPLPGSIILYNIYLAIVRGECRVSIPLLLTIWFVAFILSVMIFSGKGLNTIFPVLNCIKSRLLQTLLQWVSFSVILVIIFVATYLLTHQFYDILFLSAYFTLLEFLVRFIKKHRHEKVS